MRCGAVRGVMHTHMHMHMHMHMRSVCSRTQHHGCTHIPCPHMMATCNTHTWFPSHTMPARSMERFILGGQRMAWPKLERIRCQRRLERILEECAAELGVDLQAGAY